MQWQILFPGNIVGDIHEGKMNTNKPKSYCLKGAFDRMFQYRCFLEFPDN